MQSIAKDLAKTHTEYALLIVLFAASDNWVMTDAERISMAEQTLEEYRSYLESDTGPTACASDALYGGAL
jgi:hypothetical protein